MTTGNTAPTTTSPETGKGSFFTLRNVTVSPLVPAVAQPVTIAGDIYLFGIPWLALSWITADVTIPKADLDVTNPVIHIESMAYGGKFSLTIKGGVSRQGNCSALVQLYGGPTYKEAFGVGGIITLPPFSPVVATVPAIAFTVSGTLTQDFTVGAPGTQGEYVTGGTVQLDSQITNTTDVDTPVTIHLQVYNQGNILGITYNGNPVTDATIGPVTIPAGEIYYASWTYTEGPSSGSRDVIITVQDANKAVVGQGTFDGLYKVIKPVATKLTISPSTIVVGDTIQFEIDGFAPAETVNFTVSGSPTVLAKFTTNDVGTDIDSFIYLGVTGAIVLVATGNVSGKSAQASLTVNPASTLPGARKLVVSPNAIPYGGNIDFTLTNFPANDGITFWIVSSADETPYGNGYVVQTDNNGSGSGSIGNNEPTAGTYYLIDGQGDVAQFTTSSGSPGAPGGPPVIIDVPNTTSGGTFTFNISNFTPNSAVTISEPNGNSTTVIVDETGDANVTMTNTEPAGTYVLTAKDTAGLTATSSSFNVVAPATVTFKVYLTSPHSLYMSGNELAAIFSVGAVPVTKWTCSYYDPVTKSLVNTSSLTPTQGVSFNVNPGGYIVTTFTSSSGTTAPIQSSTFAAQNGDVWEFNPNLAESGQAGNMQLSTGGTPPAPTPTLTLPANTVNQNSEITFDLTGFLANEVVTVSTVTTSPLSTGMTVTTDSNGNASGDLTINLPKGSYTLQAIDSTGNQSSVAFTVTGPAPYIVVSPASIASGEVVTWTFYNFTPGQSVGVSVIGGGGVNVTANSLGAGGGSFVVTETVAGNYGIQAQDSLGEYAMALFAVTVPASGGGGVPPFPAPGTVGDGQYWFYIVFQAAYGGGGTWIGSNAYYDEYDPEVPGSDFYELSAVYGPYDSGATS